MLLALNLVVRLFVFIPLLRGSGASRAGEQPSAAQRRPCLLHDNDSGRETQMARSNPPPLQGEREGSLIGPEVDREAHDAGRTRRCDVGDKQERLRL